MAKKLGEKDYREHLRDQICFLQSSAKSYDLGTEIEAKRMAVSLRVLLYDTKDSSSLLGQMQLKKKMKFISTAQKYDSANLLSQQCLLSMTIGPSGGRYNPLFENNNHCKLISCREWGYEVVFCDTYRKLYRRKDLIQLLANMDGGAHVDAELSDNYSGLKTNSLTGWVIRSEDGTDKGMENDPVYASMRQMTFEVLQSLYRIKQPLFSEKYF
ncbi:hypothetical protein [Pseudoflavonifractor sp. 524-17]|uniref:hypothetical protein n=1 Tax=Pseudoflavonifractor sp. 524-17 TaxID=2304577 RepID=UPI00137A0578|nr:hypothetical protein [Pseudoflavonifractor sp. 524-17]